ncbi:MAG: universal stress protein, partial [Actinobacteria bacterium]|nr:universal stress protein [Actinomycetota bacterium]
MDIITVGVDGSMGAASALEFAVEEAQRRDGTLRVVCVWEPP